MGERNIDSNRLEELLRKRLLRVPAEIRGSFPSVFSEPEVKPYVFVSDKYVLLAALNRMDRKRIARNVKRGREPFPGLISPDALSVSASIRLQNLRNGFVTDCGFSDVFAFSLGEDCSLVVVNTKLTSRRRRLGVYNYTIGLAYIVSFGDDINSDNVYDFFEDLIAYSLKQWRGNIASQSATS